MLLLVTPLAVLNMLPPAWFGFELSNNVLLTLVLLALLSIASATLRADPSHIHESLENQDLKMKELLTHTRGRITAVRPDREPHIWEGFKGSFYAINPPWLIEEESSRSYSEMVKAHSERYLDSEFQRATYVFFTQGEERKFFPKAISRFARFASEMLKINPDIKNKIRVVIVDDTAPAFTLFLGSKSLLSEENGGQYSYSITYINDRPLMSLNGLPKWALISINQDYNNSLEDYAKDIVDDHESVALGEFLKQQIPVETISPASA